jgi:DNA polymerase III subunit delta'
LLIKYLSWQGAIWNRLTARRDRLPHALLFLGRHGTGKLAFARAFAGWLLCESPTQSGGCGQCASCRWIEQGGHPDLRLVEPEAIGDRLEYEDGGERRSTDRKPRRHIAVDQVRALANLMNVSAHRSGFKVVIIAPVESMNAHAANALLKTLEEPPPNTLFLLVSHRPRRILPTILSRCEQVSMPTPDQLTSEDWLVEQGIKDPQVPLAEAGFAPVRALALADPGHLAMREIILRALSEPARLDAIEVAERLQAAEPPVVVGWLQRWCYDLLRLHIGDKPRFNPDFRTALDPLARAADIRGLLALIRLLSQSQRIALHPLNTRLFLESLLLYYRRSILPDKEAMRG